jgi:hypothetical protein
VIGKWISILEKIRSSLETDKVAPSIDLVKKQSVGSPITGLVSGEDLSEILLYVTKRVPSSGESSSNQDRAEILSSETMEPANFVSSKDGSVNFFWSGKIFSLCNIDNESDCRPATVYNAQMDTIHYVFVPVRLEGTTYNGKLTLIYTLDARGEYTFLGGWPGVDDQGNAIRELISLSPGDKIYTTTFMIDYNDADYFDKVEKNAIIVSEGFGPTFHKYNDDYELIIGACDFSDNCGFSQNFKFTVS